MPRNWSAEPEQRMINNMMYRRTRYGQGQMAPESNMIRNMRQQEEFHRPVASNA